MELVFWVLVVALSGVCTGSIQDLHQLFYRSLDNNYVTPCFRLTNATHQIGCSASSSNTQGVLYYVDELDDITQLEHSAPHAPYIVAMEAEVFRGDSVKKLKSMESKVKGIILRHNINSTLAPESILDHFSPERKCPNDGFGENADSCERDWNENGTDLLFTDFGNFPIFMIESSVFDNILECYNEHNNDTRGGFGDFPLCSVELTADMAAAGDTPTCFRRRNLPIPYLNGAAFCDPLGDLSVWGSLYNLTVDSTEQVIMLAAKLDSISFFPSAVSYGGSSEVAGIATLLAILEQLGDIKRTYGTNVTLTRPILYAFFHGETWDYIGSSRMAYDMKHDDGFPENQALPRLSLGNIGHFLELGQLGLISNRTLYVHGDAKSEFFQYLEEAGENVSVVVESSSAEDLPPASLQRFLREGVMEGNGDFSGSVLTSFDDKFDNRFFGSRFDNEYNFGGRSIDEVSADLAAVATAVAKAVFRLSKPNCTMASCEEVERSINASQERIGDVLTCFLSNSSCELFQSVLIKTAGDRLVPRPLSRYVTVNTIVNAETVLTKQLASYLTANSASELANPVNCSDCLSRISDENRDPTVNITWMQYIGGDSKDLCYCIESFTYTHAAVSPVFDYGLGYDSDSYSTWAESRWNTVTVRLYLIAFVGQEVGFFFLGLFLTVATLLFSIQCTRKGKEIFTNTEQPYVLTTLD